MEDYKIRELQQSTSNTRLHRLRDQSARLDDLSFQLANIKRASFRRNFGEFEVSALCIIQNGEIVFKVFVDNETKIALQLLKNEDHFDTKCLNLYLNHDNALNGSYETLRLIEETYTLFIKGINKRRYLIFLIKNKENLNEMKRYNIVDLMETLITETFQKLKQQNDGDDDDDAKVSIPTAIIEIADEVFGGGDDEMDMDEIEFVTAMRVRLGIADCDKNRLKLLFLDIWNYDYVVFDRDRENQSIDSDIERCITFTEFLQYFNDKICGDELDEYVLSAWNHIKNAIYESPLRKRNQMMRRKENISVMKTKDTLYKMEKMINLLEQLLLFNENDNDEIFWRNRILKHRKIMRLFQDSVLTQVLDENERIKERMHRFIKIQNDRCNESLHDIEERYYDLLKRNKEQHEIMKKCEKMIKRKDDEIYRLKCKLINARHCNRNVSVDYDLKKKRNINVHCDTNDKLLRLKGEIAKKKLNVQKQLNLFNRNIDI